MTPARESLAWTIARRLVGCLSAFCVFWANGCAATPYQYGRFHPSRPDGVDVQPVVVEYGRPNKTLDSIGWVVGLPTRILAFNKNVNNHKISLETLDKLRSYLEQNDITDVYVAVDRYDPKNQWKRLRENDRMSPIWRYSFGAVTCLGYTVLPNRIFGGDRYNPFTNTLNLSSDVPAMVLSEAAYAKDIHGQRHPGAYAAIVNDLPVLSVVRQARAASDVLGYARVHTDWPVEKQAYHVLYPQMGIACVGPAGLFVPVVGPYLDLGGALVGHAAGRSIAAVRESQLPKVPPQEPLPAEPAYSRELIADHDGKDPAADEATPAREGVMQASYEEQADQEPAW